MVKNTNRDSLLTLLKPLEGKRAAAAWLRVLVEKNLINESQIMQLLRIFLDIIYQTHSKTKLTTLKKIVKK